jgi:hypothetical protein
MKHSAYRSMKIAKEGNTKNKDGNLRRWIEEDWRNLTPYAEGIIDNINDTEECGKKHKEQKGKSICRPMKKVNENTPNLATSYSIDELKKAVEIKNKGETIKWDELKGGKKPKIDLKLKFVPKLGSEENFEFADEYTDFFKDIEPKINYLIEKDREKLTDKEKKMVKMFIRYYITVFNDYVNNYTRKPKKDIVDTYNRVITYSTNANLPLRNLINKKYIQTQNDERKKIIEVSKNTGRQLKPCKVGYRRSEKTNRCVRDTNKSVEILHSGVDEPPIGTKRMGKNEAIKSNMVSFYGLNKLFSDDIKKWEKIHKKKITGKGKNNLLGGSNYKNLSGLGYPLGDDDIKKILPDAKIIDYEQLKNYSSIDELLPNNGDYVILLYEHEQNSGHWCCISKFNDKIEFFCSYGTYPDRQLKWVDYNTRKELGSDIPLLSYLFDKSPYEIIYNDEKYQNENPDIATCGKYCVIRILKMLNENMDLEQFEKWFKSSKPSDITYDEYINQLFTNLP